MEDYKYLFKIVLIGDAGVGKTCLVRRFTQGLFPPGQAATIGVDFMIKTVEIDGERVKLQIWDTAGQEKFRSITQSYYRAANALILVYDVCSQATFDSLPQWISDIESFAKHKVLAYLVDTADCKVKHDVYMHMEKYYITIPKEGNKIDQINSKEVPTYIGKQWADRFEMRFLETSAKDAENVDILFYDIAMELTKDAREKDKLESDCSGFNISPNTKTINRCTACFKF